MSESEHDTYWPGYVDALSNMVLALIFVVLVLALALSQYSAMSARQIAEDILESQSASTAGAPENAAEMPATEVISAQSATEVAEEYPSEAQSRASGSERATADAKESAEQTDIPVQTGAPPAPLLPLVIRVLEDEPHFFTAAEAVRVEDADGDLSSVELSVLNGTLRVEPREDLEIIGQDSARLMLRGPQDKIAAVLGSLSYQGAQDYFGKDNLVLRASDASGGETVSVADLTVTPVNDAPVGVDGRITALADQPYVFSLRDFVYSDVEDDRLLALRLEGTVEEGQLLAGAAEVGPGSLIAAEQVRRGELVFLPPVDAAGVGPIIVLVRVVDAGGVENGGQDTAESPSRINIDLLPVAGRMQSPAENTVAELPKRDPGPMPVRNLSSTAPGEEIREMTEPALPEASFAEEMESEGQDPALSSSAALTTQDPTRPGAADDAGNVLEARIQPDAAADEEIEVMAPSSLSTGPTGEIVIQFPDRVVALDESTTEILAQQIRLLGEPAQLRLSVVILSPFPNLTVERSVAMTRGISVWQRLLAAGVPADAMTIRIEQKQRTARLGEVRISRIVQPSAD